MFKAFSTARTDAMLRESLKVKLCTSDIFIIAVVVVLSIASLLLLPKQGDFVSVQWRGELIYYGSLSVDTVITTPDGLNAVQIKNGQASMIFASCEDGVCCYMGFATPSRPIICLPNEVVIVITSKNGSEGADSTTW